MEFEEPTKGRGHWISLEVSAADAEHAWLKNRCVDIVQPPDDQTWEERYFVIRDPDGVLIYIAHKFGIAEAMKPFFKRVA